MSGSSSRSSRDSQAPRLNLLALSSGLHPRQEAEALNIESEETLRSAMPAHSTVYESNDFFRSHSNKLSFDDEPSQSSYDSCSGFGSHGSLHQKPYVVSSGNDVFSMSPKPSFPSRKDFGAHPSSSLLSFDSMPSSAGTSSSMLPPAPVQLQPSKPSPALDPELRRMLIDDAPSGIMIDFAPEEEAVAVCGDDFVPELPNDYERASSVSCVEDVDAVKAALRETLKKLRCDFDDSNSSKISGTAYYHSAPVEFRINVYRNSCFQLCSLTVEVHRICGRCDVFSRFFDEVVENLQALNVLCESSRDYPTGQFNPVNCGGQKSFGVGIADELSIPGSSVSSSQRPAAPSASASAECGDDEKFDGIPMRPGLSRNASLPAPSLGVPPIPSFPPRPAFSAFVPPRRRGDLTLSKRCVLNLMAPFRPNSRSTREEKRAAAITLARACENTDAPSHLLDDEILSILEQLLYAEDKELIRCGTTVLCRLFEWSNLKRDSIAMLWDRFHPIIVDRRGDIRRYNSPELHRYVARMISASLASGMSCSVMKARLSASPSHAGLSNFLQHLSTHECTQVKSHSERALTMLKDCAKC